jgi:glucose/mannose-6-phosphate isomerase
MGELLQKTILTNQEEMQKIDKENMMEFYANATKHYSESWNNAQKIKLDYPMPKNIVIAGMGGSAIGGELAKDYTRDTARVPIEVSREYKLPNYADRNTLVFLASYSGDTEETLGSFLDALERKCMTCCVSSGGALIEYAQKLNVPYLRVLGGMPPRAALPHMFLPLLKCLNDSGLSQNVEEEFSEATKILKAVTAENEPAMAINENPAKRLAIKLNGRTPVVYGFGLYRGIALRFKQQFNENAKVPAKWETFSELNHNETMGWENAKDLAKCYGVVFIRDKAEPLEIKSRIETTKSLMLPALSNISEIWTEGKNNLSKMLYSILLGDFTSVYLAYLRNVDPTPVATVTMMKETIEKNGIKKKILNQLKLMT